MVVELGSGLALAAFDWCQCQWMGIATETKQHPQCGVFLKRFARIKTGEKEKRDEEEDEDGQGAASAAAKSCASVGWWMQREYDVFSEGQVARHVRCWARLLV